uniref:Uncharacterized protein n=1 Tax=Romanomermis culicivorax TaxID=13658 RepID=A0A915J7S5_ROMCU
MTKTVEVFDHFQDKKWANNNPNSPQIDKKIARMIAIDDQLFQFVENIGFMDLMKEIPLYQLKWHTFYKNKIHAVFHDKGINIVEALHISGLGNDSCTAHKLNLVVKLANQFHGHL